METTVGGSKLAILLGPGRPKSRLPGWRRFTGQKMVNTPATMIATPSSDCQ